jgi:CDP-diacylglycerol--serine O-phosphatidyltransferase
MSTSRLDDFSVVRRKSRLRRLKEVPVLPSLITLGNLFFGFLAISKVADALQKAQPGAMFATVMPFFELAAILVFVAMVFDALDGRVARMTGQATPFGAQLDSMADMVTFGVAPAFLGKVLVDWHAQTDPNQLLPLHPKLFYGAAAVYVVGAALRLARFNVETGTDEADHRSFKGLPSPAAAAVVCSLVALFCSRNDPNAAISHWLLAPEHFDWIVRAMPAVLAVTGLLMVSRVPFPHALHALTKGKNSLPVVAAMAVLIVIAALEWPLAMAVCTFGYVLFGLGHGLLRWILRQRDDDDDGDELESAASRPAPGRN